MEETGVQKFKTLIIAGSILVIAAGAIVLVVVVLVVKRKMTFRRLHIFDSRVTLSQLKLIDNEVSPQSKEECNEYKPSITQPNLQ